MKSTRLKFLSSRLAPAIAAIACSVLVNTPPGHAALSTHSYSDLEFDVTPSRLYESLSTTDRRIHSTPVTQWETYYEDNKVKIEYRIYAHDDEANDLHFHFYQLRVSNQTQSEVNVQWVPGYGSGEAYEYENGVSIILQPGETKTGRHPDVRSLYIYIARSDDFELDATQPLKLNKIKSYVL